MWKILTHAKTEEAFLRAWAWLTEEFSDQEELLQYLQASWLPLREQWAEHCTRRHLNFGQGTTSQTEASNFNIKSMLITGKSDLLRVTKALREMCQNQLRNYNQAVAQQNTRIKRDYLHQEYLGDLPLAISLKALEWISLEKRHAQKALNDAIARGSDEVPACDNSCTTWLQFRLPCRHTIHQRLKNKEPLTLQDLDPRWLLNARIDEQERYLRIRDPLPAEQRRGRPVNEPIPIIRELVIPQPPNPQPTGSQAGSQGAGPARRGGQRRGGRPGSQRGGRGGSQGIRNPPPPRGNSSAGRLNPSIRRRLSQFETEPDHQEDPGPEPASRRDPEPRELIGFQPENQPERQSRGPQRIDEPVGSQGAGPCRSSGTTRSGRAVQLTTRAQESQEQFPGPQKRPRRG